jgi:hypothetical protein
MHFAGQVNNAVFHIFPVFPSLWDLYWGWKGIFVPSFKLAAMIRQVWTMDLLSDNENNTKVKTAPGPGVSVGIATDNRVEGPGIESRRGRDFPHLSRPALGPPSLLYNGYRDFPGGRKRPGRNVDPSPLSSAEV